MLKDAAGIRRVVIACGFVDLRKGIDGLAQIIGSRYGQNPFEKGTLFLFCGRRSDRMKGLLWMGNGFLLLYKRFEDGSLAWPRATKEAVELTEDIDALERGGLNRIQKVEYDAGGKGINVSKTIRELGGTSIAAGFLGGNAGRTIEAVLNEKGIQNDFIWVDGETRTACQFTKTFFQSIHFWPAS